MSCHGFDGSDDFYEEEFRGVSLEPGERVHGKQFEACRFEDCTFQQAELVECSFRESAFAACDLSVANVTNTSFLEVAFRRCKLTGVDWTVARWSAVGAPVVFEDQCVLDLSVFLGVTLRNAVFRDCRAHQVDFSEADLTGCDFSGTDLLGARFDHTKLTQARFENAFNYTIDLRANTAERARFALPEAASLLHSLGVHIVDREPPPS